MTIQRRITELSAIAEQTVVGAVKIVGGKHAATGYTGIVGATHQVVAMNV